MSFLVLPVSTRADENLTQFAVFRSGADYCISSMAVGDVNGDGRLDLVTNDSSGVNYFENVGPGLSVDSLAQHIMAEAVVSVALGDMDGDGDPDLITGNLSQPSKVYRNDDGLFVQTPIWETSDADRTQSVTAGDLDGDGDLEVICANANEAVVYRNDDGNLTRGPTWRSRGGYASSVIALGDLDADGDLDLVSGSSFAQATAYFNDGSMLDDTPAWISRATMPTGSIALGDLDGDGDLDLVCGNTGQASVLFRNDAGMLTRDPIWSSMSSDQTESVALGDLGRDGDLDLICGNLGQATTVYENQAGALDTMPAWTSGRFDATRSIAMADFDRDGNLDLMVGNYCQPFTIFAGMGGDYFDDAPFWRDGLSDRTNAAALADLDTDGDLDLVCAYPDRTSIFINDGGELPIIPDWSGGCSGAFVLGDVDGDGYPDLVCSSPTVIAAHRNDGRVFQELPFWQVSPADPPAALALGDLDGDGDLDLVCGGSLNYAYRNKGGVFESAPMWEVPLATNIRSIALGDLDGDADLDLVCGPSSYFLNSDGVLASTPITLQGFNDPTTSIALGDIDQDGYLDLVCGNSNRNIKMYRNVDGRLTDSPTWLSSITDATNSVALGDLDADGDLDLVCGNYLQPSSVYRNESGSLTEFPIWRFDSRQSTNQVLLGDMDEDGDLDLISANGDGVGIFRGGQCPAFRGDPLHPTDQLPNNPAFLRSVHIDRLGRNLYQVSFKAVDVDSDAVRVVAGWQSSEAPGFHPVDIPGLLSTSPSGEFHAFNWDVSSIPADAKDVSLRLLAVSGTKSGGPVQQIPPYLFNPEQLDIRAARMRLPDSLYFPVTTIGDTSVANLHVINSGTEALTLTGLEFQSTEFWTSAVFPVLILPRTSLDISIRFSPSLDGNRTSQLTLSGNDPTSPSSSLTASASAQPLLFTTADQSVGGIILQGSSLNVYVFMDQTASADSAEVMLWRPATSTYSIIKMIPIPVQTSLRFTGEIPADSIGARSFQYTVQVFKGSHTYESPTRFLRVRVTDMPFPAQPARTYRLITLPVRMEGTIGGSLLDDLGASDPSRWRMFAYDTAESSYHEIPDERYRRWELGRGYWMITRDGAPFDSGPEEGLSLPDTSGNALIRLQPGWNLIGNPYPFPVAWDPYGDHESDESWLEPPIRWNGNGYDPEPVLVLMPNEGYWMANRGPESVELVIPALEVTPLSAPSSAAAEVDAETGWRLQILATSGPGRDDANFLGESVTASEDWDRSDRMEPPFSPGPAVSVYFPHADWNQYPGNYTRDFRPPAATLDFVSRSGRAWEFDVETRNFPEGMAEGVDLEFQGIQTLSAEQEVRLYDRVLGRTIDVRSEPRYTFFPDHGGTTGNEPRFELRVGGGDFMPVHSSPPSVTRLLPNRPNPFRSNTVFRYDVAEGGPVTLRIYDLRGRLVRTLEDEERTPGRYEVPWSGDDDRNQALPPGVYFARLTVRTTSHTHKLLRIE